MTFMTAYGSIDCCSIAASHKYLTEILKEEYRFDGFIVTDWENYSALTNGQCITNSMDEACVVGVAAGDDMAMNSYEFYEATIKAVKEGRLKESMLDDSVRRILRVKEKLGILEEDGPVPDRSVIGSEEHQKVNYDISKESIVLLKNDGILPLKSVGRIAVVGPNADNIRAQYGDWTYFSHPSPDPEAMPKERAYSVLKGVKEVFSDAEIVYAKGCGVSDADDNSDALLHEALSIAKDADVVIAVLGDDCALTAKEKIGQSPFFAEDKTT